MRRATAWAVLLASGCCFGAASEPPAPPTSIAPSAPSLDPACLGLCERLAACDRDEGRAPSAIDCTVGCAPGGVYAGLDATGLACAEQHTCDAVRTCAGPGLAVALLEAIATGAPTTAPPEWPPGFPTVPGGTPRAAPSMGPVRVGLLAYPGRDVTSTESAYREALAGAGWSIEEAPASPEARRFVAARGTDSVSVSIYRDGVDTVVQTMQLGLAP